MTTAAATTTSTTLRGHARRARHRARHAGLALASGAFLRVFNRFFAPEVSRVAPPDARRAVLRRFDALLERDLSNVERGEYPEALLSQLPLGEYARRVPEGLIDVPRMVRRRRRAEWRKLPPEADLSRFPRYYLRNFHWQPDGWLSDRSARLYDLEVELLFGGTADVMRRMAIPPLRRGVAGLAAPRILDVACGTGRFLSQVRRAIPGARLTGIDLSAPYLREAARVVGGPVELVEGNAEALPFADGAFDAVTSVFLFHELPRAARRNVLREARRVLAPGGTLAICDSSQRHDAAELEPFLEAFGETYHEPFYRDYVEDPLEAMLEAAGFTGIVAEPHLVSKVVSARAPARP
jgi:ubiquinone/menaquinone biosynthesis C-methylase UbiE